MSRNHYQLAFARIGQEVLPPGIDLKVFAPDVYLHPLIRPEGGWVNEKTIFGLIQPAANGRTLIVQVSPKTEELMAVSHEDTLEFLRADLKLAVTKYDANATDHTHAFEKRVVL